jgi:hypothetical protein
MLQNPNSPVAPRPSICVFHLVWAPLGLDPFRRFLSSYMAHTDPLPHRLHILFNGFASDDETRSYRESLAGIEHDSTFLERPVQDIPAYLTGAARDQAEFVCFLNSHSVILESGWLTKLYDHASRPSVGLVGATGSYQSKLTDYLTFFPTPWKPRLGRNPFKWPGTLRRWSWYQRLYRETTEKQQWVLANHEPFHYPPFPNPHIRTNAFMLRRDRLLDLKVAEIRSKQDAYRFESGPGSLTRQIQALGLEALVVGRDGRGYRVEDWYESRTYKRGDQENLLISDNQTRSFDQSDPDMRRSLIQMVWGVSVPGDVAATTGPIVQLREFLRKRFAH